MKISNARKKKTHKIDKDHKLDIKMKLQVEIIFSITLLQDAWGSSGVGCDG